MTPFSLPRPACARPLASQRLRLSGMSVGEGTVIREGPAATSCVLVWLRAVWLASSPQQKAQIEQTVATAKRRRLEGAGINPDAPPGSLVSCEAAGGQLRGFLSLWWVEKERATGHWTSSRQTLACCLLKSVLRGRNLGPYRHIQRVKLSVLSAILGGGAIAIPQSALSKSVKPLAKAARVRLAPPSNGSLVVERWMGPSEK